MLYFLPLYLLVSCLSHMIIIDVVTISAHVCHIGTIYNIGDDEERGTRHSHCLDSVSGILLKIKESHLRSVSHQPQYGSLAVKHWEHVAYAEQLCTRTRYTCVNKRNIQCHLYTQLRGTTPDDSEQWNLYIITMQYVSDVFLLVPMQLKFCIVMQFLLYHTSRQGHLQELSAKGCEHFRSLEGAASQ